MTKKKMHHLYLHIARVIITFAPFLYLIVQVCILTFSQGNFGFEWSDVLDLGFDNGWYANMADQLDSNVGGVWGLLWDCFSNLFTLLGIDTGKDWVYFLMSCSCWLVLSQLIYFVVWVFDWLIDFMMDLIDMFRHKVIKHE